MRPSYVVLHHSLTKDQKVVDWDAITKYHMQYNGWKNNGYHYGCEFDGDRYKIKYGRREEEEGAHCKDAGMNNMSIGICMVGDFDFVAPDPNQLTLTVDLILDVMRRWNIRPDHVIGHREAQAMAGVPPRLRKTCPGKRVNMDAIRALLAFKEHTGD